MKAFVLTERNRAQWIDIPVPEIGEFDALVKVTCAAPCTTDIHQMQDTTLPTLIGHALGHEAAGVVEKVGAKVKSFQPGDRVLIPCTWSDFKTTQVQRMGSMGGKFTQPHTPYSSPDAYDGRFVEFTRVEDADLTMAKIPDRVADEAAVMVCDMMCTAWPGVEKLNVGFGDTIVVLGIGPVGLMGVAGIALRGAARIIAVGHREITKKAAREYGATDIVDYVDGDVYDQIMELTDGQAVDGVLICSGGSASSQYNLALKLVKWGGVVSNVAFYDRDKVVEIENELLFFGGKDKTIHTTMIEDSRDIYERYLRLIEYGKVDTSKLVTHVFHGWDKLEEGLELMGSRNPDVIKPVVLIGQEGEEAK
ncbi:MAG TPA: alcohol dehydrogenase catalytic domain-containing protein [Candidatus Dorea gallistercoris]|uniref:Alcohol dehydrogenase catalytic domain-containing protein n=1 Tax=Candidatus Dorea gallistercoris TaxID=2838542 RepID=A0A9D1UDF6_9FIRM|nr:alcohol dehydrogenase catalytic domain-containing protein [Candidatus Dorea gallistercoris]